MNGASRWLDAWTAPAAASSAAAQARASGVSDQGLRFMRISSFVRSFGRAPDAPAAQLLARVRDRDRFGFSRDDQREAARAFDKVLLDGRGRLVAHPFGGVARTVGG